MIVALIISALIVFIVLYVGKHGLPAITIVHVNKDETPEPTPVPIPEQQEEPKEPNDRERMDSLLADTASTVTALLRGEVDFDELRN